jgi:hypothetical protein
MWTILTTINIMSYRNGLVFSYPANVSHLRPLPRHSLITNHNKPRTFPSGIMTNALVRLLASILHFPVQNASSGGSYSLLNLTVKTKQTVKAVSTG